MKTRWVLAAVLLARPALGIPQDPKPQDVTLTCKPTPMKEKQPSLGLSGTANLPDNAVLKINLDQEYETFTGTRLASVFQGAGGSLIEVKSKKFQHSILVNTLGCYTISLSLPDEFQRPNIMEMMKGKVTTRSWVFNILAFGDDLVARLGPKLTEMDQISKECVDIATKIEKLATNEGSWIKEKKNEDARGADVVLTKEAQEVIKDANKMMARLDRSDLKQLYPATFNEIYQTLRALIGNAQRFNYEQGKFAGAKNYHFPGKKLEGHRGEEFNFENVKRYFEEAVPLAGREMALWIVKDLKRTDGQMRADIQDALKTYGQHAGLSSVSARLATATAADLKGFEDEIRTAPTATGDAPKDKAKDAPAPAAAEWVCPVCKKKNKAADSACKATASCQGMKP